MARMVALGALLATAVTAQTVPHAGTWQMNASKSRFDSGPAPATQTREYRILQDARGPAYDMLQATQTTILPDGSKSVGTYSARFDGTDHPATGSPVYDSIALTRVDANTFDAVLKREGKVVQTARNVVSPEGNVMTVTVNGSDAAGGRRFTTVIVLEKQAQR